MAHLLEKIIISDSASSIILRIHINCNIKSYVKCSMIWLAEPWTVGASVVTILLFDTLKHKDLEFTMDTTGLNTALLKIWNSNKDIQNQTINNEVNFLGCGPHDPL